MDSNISFSGLYISLGLMVLSILIIFGGQYWHDRYQTDVPTQTSSSCSSTIAQLPTQDELILANLQRIKKYDVGSLLPGFSTDLLTSRGDKVKHHAGSWNSSILSDFIQFRTPFTLNYTAPQAHVNLWAIASTGAVLHDVLSLSSSTCALRPSTLRWQVFVLEADDKPIHPQNAQNRLKISGMQGARLSPESLHVISDMELRLFLNQAARPMCGAAPFYSATAETFDSLAGHSFPYDVLRVSDILIPPAALAAVAGSVMPIVSMLAPGSALQARISEYHIMRVQLEGTARYTLFPPEHSQAALDRGSDGSTLLRVHHLAPFPSIHVAAGQAQADLYSNKFLEGACNGCHVVTVKRGTVVYIPPYWHVHSEGLQGISVTADVSSPSIEQLALSEALFMQLPFGETGSAALSTAQRHLLAQIYLVHIIARVHSRDDGGTPTRPRPLFRSPREFALQLYESRYALLYPKGGLWATTPASLYCQLADDLLGQPASASSSSREATLHRTFSSLFPATKEGESLRSAIIKAAEFVAACVNDGSISDPTKAFWLQNYSERLAMWALGGEPEQALRFLLDCLHQETLLAVVEEVPGPAAVKLAV